MKYLDDRITIQMDLGAPWPSSGIYKYVIYEYDARAFYEEDEIIFTGNFFYDRNSRYYTFDITDIVRSRKYMRNKELFLNSNAYNMDANLLSKFRIRIYMSSGNITSQWNTVVMTYRYPNVKMGLTDGDDVFGISYDESDIVYPLIQGYYSDSKTPPLVSHYPLKQTNKYKFCQSFITSNDVVEFNLWLYNIHFDEYYNLSSGEETHTNICLIPLAQLFDWSTVQQNLDRDVLVRKGIADEFVNEIAVLDYCYKHYYLLWQDRYGGYQSQAFNENTTFSETFDVSETQNYRNERKKSLIQVQPKWRINSGWIKEDVYPYYESIFVSPILILYDAYEDKAYEVITNGSYTEKTYRNEKKMLNLSLDLEAVSTQNIIY